MTRLKKSKHLPTLPSLLQSPGTPFIHRDLSWLQFNERVLANARASSGNPLLERIKFIAISAANLDEFFMIRFASLNRKLKRIPRGTRSPQASAVRQAHANLLENIAEFGARQAEALDAVVPELEAYGVHVVRKLTESPSMRPVAERAFREKVLALVPKPRRFRYEQLAALENAQVGVYYSSGLWVPLPKTLSSVVAFPMSDKEVAFFFVDDLMMNFSAEAFGLDAEASAVRVTRDSDFSIDFEGADDPATIPETVVSHVKAREKGNPVRLQYRGNLSQQFHERAMRVLRLGSDQLFPSAGALGLPGLWTVFRETPDALANRPELKWPTITSRVPKPLRERKDPFEMLKRHDYLLHHPYDSFDTFAEWIAAACADPQVVGIDQTIYRTDSDSRLVHLLMSAAKTKKIRVFIELRARFDEMNNVHLAKELKKAGVQVGYGFGDLKLHAKLSLITRKEGDREVRYSHLSTGNYNAATARLYTDLAVLTANEAIGNDAKYFFDCLWKREAPTKFSTLVTAPTVLHRRLLQHIHHEAEAARRGEKAHIVAKVNALVDEGVCAALYQASSAGVKVDLIVRGACSLIPGIGGLSRNIHVVSVVDRFLEHSRIYYFASQNRMYLSSADWMPRNFFSRLEIAFPVLDPRIFAFIRDTLIPTYLNDNTRAMELTPQGTWRKRVASFMAPRVAAQRAFEEMAKREYDGTALTEGLKSAESTPSEVETA